MNIIFIDPDDRGLYNKTRSLPHLSMQKALWAKRYLYLIVGTHVGGMTCNYIFLNFLVFLLDHRSQLRDVDTM